MRKRSHICSAGFVLFVVVMAVSCVHEIPAPIITEPDPGPDITTVCSTDSVYFEQQVLPLVTTLCGKPGCHGTTQPEEFQLVHTSISSSYTAIAGEFSSNTQLARALNEMADQDAVGYLPPTSEQLAILQKWISQGRQYNSCNSCDTARHTFQANVAPLIKVHCAGCHPAPGSASIPNLSTLAAVQTELNSYPGRLLGSIEWTAPYNTATTRMPQGGNQLSVCEQTVIRKWIEGGALGN